MIIPGLERFDSPVVIINQLYEGEDWGVVARYISRPDVEGRESEAKIGWHLSVTFPDFEDVDLDRVFGTLEAALEYGIEQVVSGKLTPATSPACEMRSKVYSFGDYEKIA